MNGKENRAKTNYPDQIFETTRRNVAGSPLLNREELRARMERVDAGETASVGGRNGNLRSYRRVIIMTTVICAILGLLFLLPWGEERTPGNGWETPITHETEGARDQESSFPEPNPDIDASTEATAIRLNINPHEEKGEEESHVPVTHNGEHTGPALLLDDLTPEELENAFGITVVDDTYQIGRVREVHMEDLSYRERRKLAEEGIDTSRPVIFLKGTIGYAPNGGNRNGEISGEFQVASRPATELTALTFPGQYHSRSLSEHYVNTYGWSPVWTHEGLREWRISGDEETRLSATDSSAVSCLIGVRLPSPPNRTDEAYLLWYVPTPELIDLLPDRYREKAAQVIPEAIERGRRYSAAFVEANMKFEGTTEAPPGISIGMISMTSSGPPYHADNQPVTTNNIPGVRYVDLTIDEGRMLGVEQVGNTLTGHIRRYVSGREWNEALEYYGYPKEADAPAVDFLCEVRGELAETYSSAEWAPKPIRRDDARYDLPSPLLYTAHVPATSERSGLSLLVLPKDPHVPDVEENPFFRKLDSALDARLLRSSRSLADGKGRDRTIATPLDRMVPVRVYLDDDPTSTSAVFWYLPTEDFITRLPERYRNEIRSEVEMITNAISQEGEFCDRIAGERSFLGICRERSGALLETGVSPNPAERVAEIEIGFRLREERRLRITLHDLSGRLVTELQPFTHFPAGQHSIPASLEGIKAGTYLMSIESDEGDRGVQRVVVGR